MKNYFIGLRKESYIFYTGTDEGNYSFRLRYSQVKEEDIRRGINIIKEELIKCRI